MNNNLKTCIYAISLNEIKHVDAFMEHCKGADLVLVCDTGSTDGTPERLKELGATVYHISQKPWRFDIPRNTALNLIPNNIDICLSIDLDEYLQPGWNSALSAAWELYDKKITRIGYNYIWNWKSDGVTPDTQFIADKIHHRRGYRWQHPVHETLYWEGDGEEVKITIPNIVLHHRADVSKSRGQYLPLLRVAVEENPNNDRMSHYYGRELMFYKQWANAITELERHLTLPSATWKEERCASMRYISRCYRNLNKLDLSVEWAVKATLEWQYTREPWLELARAAYSKKDWQTCYWATTKCLSIIDQTKTYMSTSDCWGAEPHDFAAISAFNLGLKDQAIKHGTDAVKIDPNNTRLVANLKFYIS